MLTWEDDVEVHALRKRGWTISGDRPPHRPGPQDGPQLPERGTRSRACASAPYGSVRPVRRLRDRAAGRGPASVGPHPVRRARSARVHAVVSEPDPQHPGPRTAPGLRPTAGRPPSGRTRSSRIRPGRKPSGTGWNCPIHPQSWGWGTTAHLLVGSLAHSGKWRGCAVAVDGSAAPGRRAGPGHPRPGRGDPGVAVRPDGHGLRPRRRAGSPPRSPGSPSTTACRWSICPPRRGNRKGVVEKVNHTAAQRWWRTLADELTRRAGPGRLDRFATRARRHPAAPATADGRRPPSPPSPTREPLRPVPPTPYPVIVTETRTASRQALVVLPRQPLLGATRARRRDRSRCPSPVGARVLRHRHHRRDRGRPAPAGRRRRRRHGPRQRTCHRPRCRGDGRRSDARRPHRRKERIPPGPEPRQPPPPTLAAAATSQQSARLSRFHRHRPVRLRARRPGRNTLT